MSDTEITTKPFVSQSQAGWAFATHQPFARRWARQTGPYKKLPKRKRTKACLDCVLAALKEQLSPGVTRIRGNLCNVHGRWGRCPGSSAAPSSQRVAPKKLPAAPKPKAGKRAAGGKKGGGAARAAAKPKLTPEQRTQQRQAEHEQNATKVLHDLGIPEDAAGALADLRAGKAIEDDGGLVRMGLAEQGRDGSYRLTATGRAFLSAAEAGDAGRARDALGRARDQQAGREERAAAGAERERAAEERRAEAERKQAERLAKQKKGGGGGKKKQPAPARTPAPRTSAPPRPVLGGGGRAAPKPGRKPPSPVKPQLAQALVDAAQALSEGQEIDEQTEALLVRNGLAKRNRDGVLVLTAAGQRATKKEAALKATPTHTLDSGHTGVMIALYPDAKAKQQIAATEGVTEPADDLHLTLCYLGDSTEQPLAMNKDRLIEAIQLWAAEHGQPLEGVVNGLGRFFHAEDDETNAVYVSPDVPGLPELRQSLVEVIEASGLDYSQDHGFTPHITVAYVPLDAPTPPIRIETPVVFDRATLAWGDEQYEFPLGPRMKSFAVFKDAKGQYRWIARTTTAYRDRDGEIISEKALEDDAARMTATGIYGPLRYWHVGKPDPFNVDQPWGPGLDIGDCDFSTVIGRTSIESGTFKSEALGRAFAETAADHELSPGFFHAPTEPDVRTGVFNHIRRFERSVVPTKHGRASNLFTGMTVKEHQMDQETYDKRVKAFLNFAREKGIPPEDAAAPIVALEQADKEAAAKQIAYKEEGGKKPAIIDFFRAFFADEPPQTTTKEEEAPPLAPPPAVATPDPIASLKAELDGLRAELTALKAAPSETEIETQADAPMEAMDGGGMDESEEGGLTLSAEDLAAMGQMFGSVLADALQPLVGALGITQKLDGHMTELKNLMGGYVKQKEAGDTQRADQVAALKATIDQQQAAITESQAKLTELLGDQPRGGYRPSQAADNGAEQLLAAIKDGPSGAASGPFDDLIANLFPGLAQGGTP